MKVTIVGSGYVGMSLAVLLAQNNDVTVLDIDPKRVDLINSGQSTIADPEIDMFLKEKSLSLHATLDSKKAFTHAHWVIVATPTDYDTETNRFDTSSVDSVVQESIETNPRAFVVIKSTIPVGHTRRLQKKFGTKGIFFSPEFLREGRALYDNLHPSRIIVGSTKKEGSKFASLLKESSEKEETESSNEGEGEAPPDDS